MSEAPSETQSATTGNGRPLPSQARVVVIGGGVVGCSILYHLAKSGWTDVVLLERDELTSGSSWHAAGQIHTISSDPNISRLQSYTIDLYREIEELSGHSVGLNITGGFYLASTPEWYDYLKRERSKARYMGLRQEFLSPSEVAERHPLIDPKHYIAALWDEQDGDLDPSGATYAFAKAARVLGADYHTHTPVTATVQRPDGSWDVTTPRGRIHAEIVVNCGGLWAREVGQMMGVALPVQPMEHHYLLTETIPAVADHPGRLPCGIDYEANIYFRRERQGLLLGTYEPRATPWKVEGTPTDFGHELLQPDLDRIADRLELAFDRIPALATAGIRRAINGPFTFGPDGNPLIGPVPGMRNCWVAVGVMAGFCQGGGVGRSLAEWMIEGEPSIDIGAMDVARFGAFATADWGTVKSAENYERRFVMTFPNETLPAGRRQKTTALHDRLVARGARMDQGFGLEHALWFADGPDDAFEEPSFRRNRSHAYIAREVAAVQGAVGCVETANFSKHLVEGAGARGFLAEVLAGRLPDPGRVTLCPMLTPAGRLYGDLSVACLAPDRFLVIGSGAMQEAHRRHFEDRLPATGVAYRNASDDWHGLALAGPQSRTLLQRLCRADLGPDAFRFRDVRSTVIGGVPAILVRMNFSGELGFEIHTPPAYLLRLSEAVEEAGADLGLHWYGLRTMMSLRLEKGWGAWGLEYRPDYTPAEAGLDGLIDWSRPFVGREAALRDRTDGPARRLVVLSLDATDADAADAIGDEAILHDGAAVGFVTSGGYGHRVGESLAMGYVRADLAADGTALEVELLGQRRSARVRRDPLYDPHGLRMRDASGG